MSGDDDLKGIDLRDRVMFITAQIKDLQKKREELLGRLRNECTHEAITETPYVAECKFMHALPPKRTCIICGLSEEGWGGYEKLSKGTVVRVIPDRGEFHRYNSELKPLTTIVIPEDMCGKT
ncbi:hypothetical protein A2333_00800 [Candidatus Wolfebacteria bacterium RIFOXYB2_FULL_49_7]|uniref:Uncharacterized protein n=1 Tax=Candidatus Wolfebacteria bacterium RIFOXYB1_FULL_54_12 TaxID=1802559 RepID=A0A1F8DVS4_9BACT|nr:MAG: hypothetical protein A2372_00575 [Candidatus Wolfebacteria bacterium RIFOXYB1_FULL_54_12]OGM94146.1 MAG: hypothetical protein A2333_00800 [Candidatus Wolfebacteria bacterium RIFOXYB2_FULL_49_7]